MKRLQAFIRTQISSVIYNADIQSRMELAAGIITSERDYVSALMTRVRDGSRAHGFQVFGHARVLAPGEEERFGCDAMLVFVQEESAKTCLFEAKWPRFSQNYAWDSFQRGTRQSHFSNQLQRQSRLAGFTAIWEMFIVEHPVGFQMPGFDDRGSTNVWHRNVYQYDRISRVNTTWRATDVVSLVAPPSQNGHNLLQITDEILDCRRGKLRNVEDGQIDIFSEDGRDVLAIPVKGDRMEVRANKFLQKSGLSELVVLRVDNGAPKQLS